MVREYWHIPVRDLVTGIAIGDDPKKRSILRAALASNELNPEDRREILAILEGLAKKYRMNAMEIIEGDVGPGIRHNISTKPTKKPPRQKKTPISV